MGMVGKYASLKGVFGSLCIEKVNAGLIGIGSRQRKAEGETERERQTETGSVTEPAPVPGVVLPAAEHQAHCR